MKRFCICILAVFLVVGVCQSAIAGHHMAGGEGFMSQNLPKSGGYYKVYNTFYTAAANDIEVLNQAHRIGYNTGLKFLGMDWIVDVTMNIGYTWLSESMSGAENRKHGGGFGDLQLSPFVFGWHGERYDAFISPSFFLPTGKYDKHDPTSIGLGYFGFILDTGANFYLTDKRDVCLGITARYEYNFSNHHTDTQDGADVHLELNLGKVFESGFHTALTGVGTWQVSDDKGRGEFNDKRRYKQAVGGEVGYTFKEWGAVASMRFLSEFENKNRPQGHMLFFCVAKPF